jgi:hypothetical protein
MRPQILNAGDDDESNKKRVRVEAIDFDWIFKHDNAANLMRLLTTQDNTKMFI